MDQSNAYLSKFEVYLPEKRYSQRELLSWMIQAHVQAETLQMKDGGKQTDLHLLAKLFERYAVKETQIAHRYLEVADVAAKGLDQAEIYKIDQANKQGLGIHERALYFSKRAEQIFQNAYKEKNRKPDHLIHVTCTGYVSPSPAQKIVTSENWHASTAITHAYHMGCYASMPAIRLAEALVAKNISAADFQVDVFHTEMCGLHMNPLAQSPEQMIVQSLFADGHIKYTASSKPNLKEKCLKIICIHEKIIPDSAQDMSWIPTSWGMQMNLSREVPAKIRSGIKEFLNELLKMSEMKLEDVQQAEFAIHPGGPKIIDTVKEVLELKDEKVAISKRLLLERGNMSSASLPHVWDAILNSENIKVGTKVISFAFGPGLTVFGCVMEVS